MIHVVKVHLARTGFSSFLAFLLISMLTLSFQGPVVSKESTCAYLSMTPPTHVAHEIGELFDVAISISNVENLHSLTFTLTYNQSLLDVEQVIQGTFFPSPPQSLFAYSENESRGSVSVDMSLATPEASKNGSGTLAWIVFKAVQESYGGSPISFEQTLFLDSALKPITYDSVDAVYFWKSITSDPPAEGRVLDLYTQKGGQGPNESGGEFVAGDLVYLVSLVTYNGSPVQQKLVAFQVRNPLNESVLFRGVATDADGLANMSFRIPMLMSSNGTWTAVSAVDIREEVVWDTISFRVYLGYVPVGGYSVSTEKHSVEKPVTIHLFLLAVLTAVFTVIERKKPKKLRWQSCVCTILTLTMLLSLVRIGASFQTSETGDARITNLYSCDVLGIPQAIFPKKTTAYFNISLRNPAQEPKDISIYLTVEDELLVPVGTDQLTTTIPQNASTYYIMSVFIPKWAFVGVATAYAYLFENGNPVDTKTTQFKIDPEDLTPPVVRIILPENATYVTRPVRLVFAVNERTTWIGYSLNDLENVTINGNTTIADLGVGLYRIKVCANDTSGNTGSSKEIWFTVLNRPPIASFTESATTVPTGTIISFNASSSYDPDGRIVDYFWDFGDRANGTDVTTEHAYTDNGTYTVTLIVTDNDGSTAMATANKTVLNRNPVALFVESAETALTGTSIDFSALNSFDPDGSIAAYAWDFGDGNFGSGVLVDHSYADDGVYNVTLTVMDNDGASSVTSALKTILDRPPVADFSETAEIVYVDELISFNASSSYDPDGTIVAYFWDFGDGKNGTGSTVDHGYEHNGTYAVTLTVTDDDGVSASTSAVKNVINRPDIAVSSVTSSKTVLGQGYRLEIDVTVANRGDRKETFDVTIYANATPIATQSITLTSGNSTTLAFTWDATGFAFGNYTISAGTTILPGEIDTANNNLAEGWIVVTIPGDVDGDFENGHYDVDLYDVVKLLACYGAKQGDPNFNPNCDINNDGRITLFDAVILLYNYGREDP